jgi:hypothetical protein
MNVLLSIYGVRASKVTSLRLDWAGWQHTARVTPGNLRSRALTLSLVTFVAPSHWRDQSLSSVDTGKLTRLGCPENSIEKSSCLSFPSLRTVSE